MNTADRPGEMCSIARAVGVVGDRWKLLVLHDLAAGISRFNEMVRHLGVARDVLARRVSALVDDGLVSRVQYREPGRRTRYEYLLTGKGRDFLPVLLALRCWSDKHLAGHD